MFGGAHDLNRFCDASLPRISLLGLLDPEGVFVLMAVGQRPIDHQDSRFLIGGLDVPRQGDDLKSIKEKRMQRTCPLIRSIF
jgi:hypothetical protein